MINQSKPRILWSILLYDGVIEAITTKACRSKMLSVFEYHNPATDAPSIAVPTCLVPNTRYVLGKISVK